MKQIIRRASINDIYQIAKLYHDIYEGQYPDPMMKNFSQLQLFLENNSHFWIVAEVADQLVGSVIYIYDEENLLAKVYAAVVEPSQRGGNLTQQMMNYGLELLKAQTKGIDVVYATTRTVHVAAQVLTEVLGYKKLGLFPNVHKTNTYETHGLAALLQASSLAKRHVDYRIHHQVKRLVDISSNELGIASLESIEPEKPTRNLETPPVLEFIEASQFIQYRFGILKAQRQLQFRFFPFHAPNMLIVSPDQKVEIFLKMNHVDGHCVIIGGRIDGDISYADLLIKAADMLRDRGARYIEILMRADKPKIIESILNAKFIPCAFIPAFRLDGDKRIDYLVFSRTFEMFDFQNIKLSGVNQVYLEEYFNNWKRVSLTPKLIGS